MATIRTVEDSSEAIDFLYDRPDTLMDSYHESIFNDRSISSSFGEEFLERMRGQVRTAKRRRTKIRSTLSYQKYKNRGRVDVFEVMTDLEDFIMATQVNRDIAMSHVETRRRRRLKRVEGWLGAIDDMVNLFAEKHTDPIYRMTMNGQVHRDEDTGEAEAYIYALSPTDADYYKDMTIAQIRQTWARQDELLLENGLDFTSLSNSRL